MLRNSQAKNFHKLFGKIGTSTFSILVEQGLVGCASHNFFDQPEIGDVVRSALPQRSSLTTSLSEDRWLLQGDDLGFGEPWILAETLPDTPLTMSVLFGILVSREKYDS